MAPTSIAMHRARTAPTSPDGAQPSSPSVRVVSRSRWAVSKQPPTFSSSQRTGADDGARPVSAVTLIGAETGRKSTDHTTGTPAALALAKAHAYGRSEIGVTPTGKTSRRESREYKIPAGTILMLPVRPQLCILRTHILEET